MWWSRRGIKKKIFDQLTKLKKEDRIETVNKNLPTKAQDQMASQVISIKHLEKS